MDEEQKEFRDNIIKILVDSGEYERAKIFTDDRIRIIPKNSDREFTLRIGELNGDFGYDGSPQYLK